MASVSSIAQLAAYVRNRVEGGHGRGKAANASAEASARTTAGPPDAGDVLEVRLASIDPSIPEAPLMAFRVYMTATVSAELARLEADDARLADVLERVWQEMNDDAKLHDAMTAAGRELLRASKRPE